MKQLIFLMVFVPMFAADPQAVLVWKSGNLKSYDKTLSAKLDDRKAAVEELSQAYQASIVHREGDGEVEVASTPELLIIESGQAIVVGGKIAGSKAAGQSTAVGEGDIVLIPANLPHQLLVAAGKRVTYFVIRQQESTTSSPASSSTSSASPAPRSDGKKPVQGVDLGSGFRACVPGENSPDGTEVNGYRKMISHSFLGPSCIWKPETAPETVTTGSAGDHKTAHPGADVGDGYRSCVPGDSSPAGTIADGYRKVMSTSPFGVSCGWEKIP
jgi:mannose-6-phosphate isomerase-like protein (cupin superfamily)